MSKSLYPCRTVRVSCKSNNNIKLSPGTLIEGNSVWMNGCKIAYCNPAPCIVTVGTHITRVKYYEYRIDKVDDHYIITVIPDRGEPQYYVYPSHVWETIYRLIIKPVIDGRKPISKGALLYGPPGTGKTSMIKILSRILGMYMVNVRSDEIKSKYVGETEKRLRAKFDEARANQPSIISIDDADWFVVSRSLHDESSDSGLRDSVINVLFKEVEDIIESDDQVLIFVATNRSPESIDPALRRGGRIGTSIFIPLPSSTAIRIILERLGVSRIIGGDVEKLVYKLSSRGANMGDVVINVAKRILAGERDYDKMIRSNRERGYIRPVPAIPSKTSDRERILNKTSDLIPKYYIKSSQSRFIVSGEPSILEAFLVTYSSLLKTRSLILYDEKYLDEAVITAEQNKELIIVRGDLTHPSHTARIIKIASSPVAIILSYTLNEQPYRNLPLRISSEETLITTIGMDILARIVLEYYNISYTDNDIKEIASMPAKKAKPILAEAPYASGEATARDLIDIAKKGLVYRRVGL